MGRPEKREAISQAAMTVFGREGYVRASMDAIAAEAGVSKRTVYNHFADKETLFQSVMLVNSTALTERVCALADVYLGGLGVGTGGHVRSARHDELHVALTQFAVDRARALLLAGDHGALGRAIRAEAANIPPGVLEQWLEVGPVASLRHIAAHFSRLAEAGLLDVPDPYTAADHFTYLTFYGAADRSFWGAFPLADAEIVRIASDGVDVFLAAYESRD